MHLDSRGYLPRGVGRSLKYSKGIPTQGCRQVPEVKLEDGGHAVNVVEYSRVSCQVGHPLLIKQVPGK